MAAANCSTAVASRRANYDGNFRVQTLSAEQQLDKNIDMAVGPKEEGKLGRERAQTAIPVRIKTRYVVRVINKSL
jgi:hypothetical protein